MILIADSGSTSTDWRLVDKKNKITQFETAGFNPFFTDTQYIESEIKKNILPNTEAEKITEIYYYGAGCSSEERNSVVRNALINCFNNTQTIEVHHDLLAAARAICGNTEGIAAILGTGSNSCYYDGKEIIENVTSLGYILGDEGSGGHIGKSLLKAFVYGELPDSVSQNLISRFNLTKEGILENVYKKPLPNKYLASFSKFVFQNLKEEYLQKLVADCFSEFFDRHILKYSKHKSVSFGCVGSVGYYYSNILKKVADDKGVRVGKIIETPIASLVLYHTGEK
jgi:glucosamine kinase